MVLISTAFGSELAPVIQLGTARVMPGGINSLRYNRVFAKASNRYNTTGYSKPMATLFDKGLTFKDLTSISDSTSDPTERGGLKGFLKSSGYDLNDDVGQVTGDVRVATTVEVPVFVHGITDQLTIALALPIYRYTINIDSGFQASPTLKKFAKQLKDEKRLYELNELIDNINDPTRTAAREFNYEPFESQQGKEQGDLRTVLKYRLLNRTKMGLAFRLDIVAPTGKEKDHNQMVDFPAGDGQWDAGLAVTYDYYVNPNVHLTATFGYLREFSDHVAERVPYREDSKISPDVDLEMERNLGDHFHAQVGTDFGIIKGVSGKFAYNYQYKQKDVYNGSLYASQRYKWLEKDTSQMAQTILLDIGYSTIPYVLSSDFLLPLEFHLSYLAFVKGRNVANDPIINFEFATYF